jgi:HSP20 family molecular chaperone IbpA
MSQAMQKRAGTDPAATGAAEAARNREMVLRPAGDIFEHGHGITLVLDIPGVSKDRLEIHSDRNSLVVEGSVEIDVPEGTESLHADVRSTRYRRAFSVSGEQLDIEAVQASLKDGVLRIDIPKRAELRPRKIEVQAG